MVYASKDRCFESRERSSFNGTLAYNDVCLANRSASHKNRE